MAERIQREGLFPGKGGEQHESQKSSEKRLVIGLKIEPVILTMVNKWYLGVLCYHEAIGTTSQSGSIRRKQIDRWVYLSRMTNDSY